MARSPLRVAVLTGLVVWAGIWVVFMAMRFSAFDYRGIPGIGFMLLALFALSWLLPLLASILAAIAVVRAPRVAANLLVLGCAIAALGVQGTLFLASRWM